MPLKNCPYCGGVYSALSEKTECCRAPKCVKKNQRAKKRLAAGVVEVKRGRPKSHVVQLKQKVKGRILGKAGGPSITPPASSDASDSDVPPPKMEVDDVRRIWVPCGSTEEERNGLSVLYAKDASAGLPEDALPQKIVRNPTYDELGPEADVKFVFHPKVVTFLPVEDSTSINQQAKAVLDKVPLQKVDPNSDAAVLARLNAAQKKPAKGKGGNES